MQLITNYSNCPQNLKNSIVAIGNFDGIHKGHIKLIDQVKQLAKEQNLIPGIVTFNPHPATVFRKDLAPLQITSLPQKHAIIEKFGIEVLFELAFSHEFAQITADNFIIDILLEKLGVKHIVTGSDFVFGYKRQGNNQLIRNLAKQYNFSYTEVLPESYNGEICSSSLVRNYLKTGKIDQVKPILGRDFAIQGVVIKGKELGRTIGYPTINIELGDYIRPKFGVYAVAVNIETIDGYYYGAANIGIKPTLSGSKELLEVYIFDFNQDLYGKIVTVTLLDFIREEAKFGSIEILKAQIEKDCHQIKELIATNVVTKSKF